MNQLHSTVTYTIWSDGTMKKFLIKLIHQFILMRQMSYMSVNKSCHQSPQNK